MTAHFTRISAAALFAGMALTMQPALAAERVVPGSDAELQYSYAPLVKETAPAVVNVYAERMVTRRMSPLFSDPFFGQFFGQQMPGRSEKQTSLGSGVIVEKNGTIITNIDVDHLDLYGTIDGVEAMGAAFAAVCSRAVTHVHDLDACAHIVR